MTKTARSTTTPSCPATSDRIPAETEVIAVAQENDRSMVSEGAPVFDQRDNQVVDDEDGAINDDTQLSSDQ